MKLIVITRPDCFAGEVEQMELLLQHGLEYLHLRKPGATATEVEALLRQLPEWAHEKVVLHDHHELASRYGCRGIHLNRRHPLPPAHYTGSISRSCHTLQEVVERKAECSYLFLSPIFDSISKEGYGSGFTPQVLQEAKQQGVIDQQVVALGGVSLTKIAPLKEWGFGGVALLGAIWQQPAELFLPHFLRLREEVER